MAFTIDFPHKSDGEVDWRTLGNILTGDILGQVHCASYLDPKYGHKQKRLVPDTGWEYVGMKHKIVILKKRVEGTSLDSFMGRGVINFPVERVAQYVGDQEQIYNWERFLENIEIVKQMSEDNSDTIVYRRYQATACLGNTKADVVYYWRAKYHDEKFILTGVSVSDTFHPPIHGIIRARVLPGSGYVLEPYMGDPNRTLVTYTACVSIDGIPAVTINKVMKEFAFTIHYVNEYLKRIWGFNTPASNSPTDHTDIMSDLESEYQESHLHNKDQEASSSMHVQPLEVHPDAESETDYPKDPQHSIRNDPAHQMQHFAGLYKDGEVDWDTLGQETTRSILEVVDSAEATLVDLRYRDEGRRSQHSNGWRFVYEKHDVTVYTKKHENSSIDCFIGRGIVNAPMRTVGNFIADIQSTYALNNTLVNAKCLKVLHKSEDCFDYIGYQYHEATKCLVHAKRDNLYFVRCIFANGKYVQSAISIEHSDFPSPPGTTRILIHAGSGWVMEPYQGSQTQTLVTYVAHVDLIGLPTIIANRALKWHPLAIHYVRLNLPAIQPPQLEASASSNCSTTDKELAKNTTSCEPVAQEEEEVNQKSPEKGWIISGWDIAKLS